MKKRILSLFFCALLLCSPVLPSYAFAGLTKEEIMATMITHRDYCTDRESCPHVVMYYNSFGPTDNRPLRRGLSKEEKDVIKEYVKSVSSGKILPACPHNRLASLADLDAETAILYCRDCCHPLGDAATSTRKAKASYRTSSTFSSTCQHSFSAWTSVDINRHVRFCENDGCDFFEFSRHNLTPANCTTNEHCVDCGERHARWDSAWGHLAQYIADDAFFGTTHSFRCGRRDQEGKSLCDHILFTEPCTFRLYIDPASNGTHNIYDVCGLCGNWGGIEAVTCKAVTGEWCWYCNNVGSWEP